MFISDWFESVSQHFSNVEQSTAVTIVVFKLKTFRKHTMRGDENNIGKGVNINSILAVSKSFVFGILLFFVSKKSDGPIVIYIEY